MHLKIYTEEEHAINQEDIDKDALDVIFRLKEAGYEAYLVGGSVRDLLLQRHPKDFDISTSAQPEEVKHLFGRRCLLIGKRFRLAHIRCGRKVLEVATFRAGDVEQAQLIVRDNRWGTAEDDVMRRDFTINALFYDPEKRTLLDYVGGYQDLKHHLLKTIGEPGVRFKQDPVRMIRALKFKARFQLHFDPKLEKALHFCKEEILKSAQARLLEEMFKMLESAHSASFFELMKEYHFLEILFPCFHHFFESPTGKLGYEYLQVIDTWSRREKEGQKEVLDRGLLLAALIFPILEQELITLSEDRQRPLSFSDILHLTRSLVKGIDTSSFAHFPKKLLSSAFAIITYQFRLTPLTQKPRFHSRFGTPHDFRLALQFLRVRSEINHQLKEFYEEWVKAHSHHHYAS